MSGPETRELERIQTTSDSLANLAWRVHVQPVRGIDLAVAGKVMGRPLSVREEGDMPSASGSTPPATLRQCTAGRGRRSDLLGACGSGGSACGSVSATRPRTSAPVTNASTSAPVVVTTPSQSGTVAFTGLCDRMPVAAAVKWHHAVRMVSADTDGRRENPDNFDNDAAIGSYPADIHIDSVNTGQEAVFIQVGSQYIHVEMGALYNGLDQATKQVLQDIATAVAG